jgi:membrane protein
MIAAVFSKILARALDAARFVRFVLLRWSEDRCPHIAGSLAFTTILGLVPVFAIAVALLSRSPLFEAVMVQIKIFLLLNLLPEIAGRFITVYMVEFEANAGRLTSFGLLLLLGTAVPLLITIDHTINGIWRGPRKRSLLVSLTAYLLVLVLGPVLIGASVFITTYLMALPARMPGVPAPASLLLLQGLPFAVSAAAFFLVYRLIPHLVVPWRHALAGGVVAAVLFELAKQGFAFYVAHAPMYNMVYGTFAAVPLFLLWIYLSWLIVLFGAELAAALGEWRSQRAVQSAPRAPAPE